MYDFLHNCGVYKLTFPNGKCYVGRSIHLSVRLDRYKNGKHFEQQLKLYRAIRKYGWSSVKVEVLLYAADEHNLSAAEKYYVDKFDCIVNGYNCIAGGQVSPNTGKHLTDEHKRKIGEANRVKTDRKGILAAIKANTGRKQTPEEIAARTKSNRGKKRTPETIERMRAAAYNRAPVSDSTRKILSEAQKLRYAKASMAQDHGRPDNV